VPADLFTGERWPNFSTKSVSRVNSAILSSDPDLTRIRPDGLFVVKNGVNKFCLFSLEMPTPLSTIVMRTPHPSDGKGREVRAQITILPPALAGC